MSYDTGIQRVIQDLQNLIKDIVQNVDQNKDQKSKSVYYWQLENIVMRSLYGQGDICTLDWEISMIVKFNNPDTIQLLGIIEKKLNLIYEAFRSRVSDATEQVQLLDASGYYDDDEKTYLVEIPLIISIRYDSNLYQ